MRDSERTGASWAPMKGKRVRETPDMSYLTANVGNLIERRAEHRELLRYAIEGGAPVGLKLPASQPKQRREGPELSVDVEIELRDEIDRELDRGAARQNIEEFRTNAVRASTRGFLNDSYDPKSVVFHASELADSSYRPVGTLNVTRPTAETFYAFVGLAILADEVADDDYVDPSLQWASDNQS